MNLVVATKYLATFNKIFFYSNISRFIITHCQIGKHVSKLFSADFYFACTGRAFLILSHTWTSQSSIVSINRAFRKWASKHFSNTFLDQSLFPKFCISLKTGSRILPSNTASFHIYRTPIIY